MIQQALEAFARRRALVSRQYELMNLIKQGDESKTDERDFLEDFGKQLTDNLSVDYAELMKVHKNVIAGLIKRYENMLWSEVLSLPWP